MKKTKLTRSLLAAVSIVALTAVVYGCSSGPSQSELDQTKMERDQTKMERDQAQMERDQAQMEVAALQQQINDLRAQLGLEPDDELSDSITELQGEVADLQKQIQDAADDAADAAEKARLAEMAATAAKLYAGISAQMGTAGTNADGDRVAAYSGTDDATITVTFDPDLTATGSTNTVQELKEDKDTMVADNHGWAGKRYADPAGGASVEAIVYSNVGDPTPGEKFSMEYSANFANGVLAATIVENTANSGRVASPSFDHSSGTKRFPLPDPNPNVETVVTVSGSFHGVSGTYSCTPGASAVCAVRVAADGFELGTVPSAINAAWTAGSGQWTFAPTNPSALVMEAVDTAYASYGWWIHKTENDQTYTASAFVDNKGAAPTAIDIGDLNGTATYVGGAAGKYALASSTGGTNDAGHFTARAMLEADFGDNTVTGTIDMFMGADGMSRDWSVELKESMVGDTGPISSDGTAAAAGNQTVWTIGGNAAAAAGSWAGSLQEEGSDGVPQVATGTFYSEYGTAGKMVGAFGANQQ